MILKISYTSILANFSFKIRLKKNVHKKTDTISAIGYDHHTISKPNNLAKINATGMMIINCLAIEINMLYTPFPSAWKTELQIIQYPAKTKLQLMVRSAGTPMEIICSDASNSASNVFGKNWNTKTPTIIILTAMVTLSLSVLVIRFLFRAPKL